MMLSLAFLRHEWIVFRMLLHACCGAGGNVFVPLSLAFSSHSWIVFGMLLLACGGAGGNVCVSLSLACWEVRENVFGTLTLDSLCVAEILFEGRLGHDECVKFGTPQ